MKDNIIQDIEAEIKKTKDIPKELDDKINNIVFKNMIIAIIIIIYTFFIVMGFRNISPEKYIVDLMVFSILLLFLSIIIFEIAYKKDSGKLAINGIEVLILAVITFYLPYMYVYLNKDYNTIVILLGIAYSLYYVIKSVVNVKIEKRKYKKSLNDMKNITNSNDDEIIKYNNDKKKIEKENKNTKKITKKSQQTNAKESTAKKEKKK